MHICFQRSRSIYRLVLNIDVSFITKYGVIERQRERDRELRTRRPLDSLQMVRERETETDRQTDRQTETERGRERQRVGVGRERRQDKTTAYFRRPPAPGKGRTLYIIISNIYVMHVLNKQPNTANQAVIKLLIICLRSCFQHNVHECAFHKIQTHDNSLHYEWYHIARNCCNAEVQLAGHSDSRLKCCYTMGRSRSIFEFTKVVAVIHNFHAKQT